MVQKGTLAKRLQAPPECALCAKMDPLRQAKTYAEPLWTSSLYEEKDISKYLIRIRSKFTYRQDTGEQYITYFYRANVTRTFSWSSAFHDCRASHGNLLYLNEFARRPEVLSELRQVFALKVATDEDLKSATYFMNGHRYLYSPRAQPAAVRWPTGRINPEVIQEIESSETIRKGGFCLVAQMISLEKMHDFVVFATVPCTCSAEALSMPSPFVYSCHVNQWIDCGAPGSNAHSNEFSEPVEFCAQYSALAPALRYLVPRAIV